MHSTRNDLEKQILQLEEFNSAYIQLDLIFKQLTHLIAKAQSDLIYIQLQLNMLSLGHLSPSLVTPSKITRYLITNKI